MAHGHGIAGLWIMKRNNILFWCNLIYYDSPLLHMPGNPDTFEYTSMILDALPVIYILAGQTHNTCLQVLKCWSWSKPRQVTIYALQLNIDRTWAMSRLTVLSHHIDNLPWRWIVSSMRKWEFDSSSMLYTVIWSLNAWQFFILAPQDTSSSKPSHLRVRSVVEPKVPPQLNGLAPAQQGYTDREVSNCWRRVRIGRDTQQMCT